ncbi:MAG: DsbA family oxidoreductase [Proteobacteria bacterium]|jgi:predicted DsbA family dithiol-disulfide isomerase|nr:DsbA family oxidoreductase [Pseudomonadota bacterium]MDA1042918.1 DsbA family oxidoreductase [Pseudomonadota bacterium]
MIRLDVFSDPICPWCYIGKTLLDRALEKHPSHPFVIEYHPFQLNPAMPKDGAERSAYLTAKFGGQTQFFETYGRIAQSAKEAGIDINFDIMTRVPNTLDAHRMIHWAGLEGKQAAMVAAQFRAYFREGRDLGDVQILADLAAQVGMDRAVAERLLTTDSDLDDLASRDKDAREKGVSAVPTYLIDKQYVLSGAQQPDLWAQVISEITVELASKAG